MHRPCALPTLVCSLVLLGTAACAPARLPSGSDEEALCRAMLACWYPGDQGNQFTTAGDAWKGMADPANERNIRRAYGPDGTCWHADPMAGTESDGEIVAEDALLSSCGGACACAILELCAARAPSPDPAPSCPDGVADPCDDTSVADEYCEEP